MQHLHKTAPAGASSRSSRVKHGNDAEDGSECDRVVKRLLHDARASPQSYGALMKPRVLLAAVGGAACFLPVAGVAQQRATAPPAPSACQQRLTPDIAIIHPLPSIAGPGACGAEDVVSLDAVVLKDGQRIALAPAATLRCPMAEAVAHWVREDVAPAAAATFGSPARTIVAGVSYECRGRDRIPGAKLSEHAHANALDLRGLKLANGKMADFTDNTVPKAFRETIRQSACTKFTTVLGPGSDSYHESVTHLDLIERQSDYRVCQWDVQPAPQTPRAPAVNSKK